MIVFLENPVHISLGPNCKIYMKYRWGIWVGVPNGMFCHYRNSVCCTCQDDGCNWKNDCWSSWRSHCTELFVDRIFQSRHLQALYPRSRQGQVHEYLLLGSATSANTSPQEPSTIAWSVMSALKATTIIALGCQSVWAGKTSSIFMRSWQAFLSLLFSLTTLYIV